MLAVVDPTSKEQWALQKAVLMAKTVPGAELIALLAVHREADCEDPEAFKEVELERNRLWLDDIVAGFAESGVVIETSIFWHDDWRAAIVEIAEDRDVDLVIKRASGRPTSLASSDRYLIRSLHCAMLLVKHAPAGEFTRVLLAVDWNAHDDDHVALNNAITAFGQRLRGDGGTLELHAVSAYPDTDKFVHPPDLAKKLGIDRQRAHVQQGKAVDIIPGTANRIGADLVVIGSVGRRGISGLTVGNTSEKILTDIHSDVLVIVHEGGRLRTAA
jgi:universal stress protein E